MLYSKIGIEKEMYFNIQKVFNFIYGIYGLRIIILLEEFMMKKGKLER